MNLMHANNSEDIRTKNNLSPDQMRIQMIQDDDEDINLQNMK